MLDIFIKYAYDLTHKHIFYIYNGIIQMPKLLMYLLANDYGFLNKLTFLFALFFVIILIAFIVVIAKKFGCKRQTLFYINWYASVISNYNSHFIFNS